jgi:hypothetical protein
MKGKGIQAAKLQIDWPELMRFKRSFTEPVPERREDEFAKAGIAAFHGTARFGAQTTVQAGEETLVGRYVDTSQRNIGFHGPKCPSKRNQPRPNWRCANSDLSAESNNSLH